MPRQVCGQGFHALTKYAEGLPYNKCTYQSEGLITDKVLGGSGGILCIRPYT